MLGVHFFRFAAHAPPHTHTHTHARTRHAPPHTHSDRSLCVCWALVLRKSCLWWRLCGRARCRRR
jgi:hypothetical protein